MRVVVVVVVVVPSLPTYSISMSRRTFYSDGVGVGVLWFVQKVFVIIEFALFFKKTEDWKTFVLFCHLTQQSDHLAPPKKTKVEPLLKKTLIIKIFSQKPFII